MSAVQSAVDADNEQLSRVAQINRGAVAAKYAAETEAVYAHAGNSGARAPVGERVVGRSPTTVARVPPVLSVNVSRRVLR